LAEQRRDKAPVRGIKLVGFECVSDRETDQIELSPALGHVRDPNVLRSQRREGGSPAIVSLSHGLNDLHTGEYANCDGGDCRDGCRKRVQPIHKIVVQQRRQKASSQRTLRKSENFGAVFVREGST
jgi:hypothetical protein